MEPPTPSERATDWPSRATWPLGQAKARFSEVVRLARSGRPQHVTVHGRDAVVVVASAEFERLTGRDAAPTLHALLSGSPLSNVEEEAAPRSRPIYRSGE